MLSFVCLVKSLFLFNLPELNQFSFEMLNLTQNVCKAVNSADEWTDFLLSVLCEFVIFFSTCGNLALKQGRTSDREQ